MWSEAVHINGKFVEYCTYFYLIECVVPISARENWDILSTQRTLMKMWLDDKGVSYSVGYTMIIQGINSRNLCSAGTLERRQSTSLLTWYVFCYVFHLMS